MRVELQVSAMEKLLLVRAQHPFSANMQVVLPGRIVLENAVYMDATMKEP